MGAKERSANTVVVGIITATALRSGICRRRPFRIDPEASSG